MVNLKSFLKYQKQTTVISLLPWVLTVTVLVSPTFV